MAHAVTTYKVQDLYVGIGNTVTIPSTDLDNGGPDEDWMVVGHKGLGGAQYEVTRTVNGVRKFTKIGAMAIKAINGDPVKIEAE